MSDDLDEYEKKVNAEVSGPPTGVTAKELLERPEVAEAFRAGVPVADIAQTLGVSKASVYKALKSDKMADLLEEESYRVVSHLSSRPLAKEKYLGLATALGGLIEKTRLLREEPTSIGSEQISKTTINRLNIALFGFGPDRPSEEPAKRIEEKRPERVIEVRSETDNSGEEGD